MKNLLMILGATLFMFSCGGGECEKDGKCCKDGDKKECHKDGEKHGEEQHSEVNNESSSDNEEGLTDEDVAVGAAVHTILTK